MKESEFHGLTARVIQHEVDHLESVLIIDQGIMVNKLRRDRDKEI